MKCLKTKKYLFVGLSVFIVLYFCLCSCIGSYASTTDSGNSYVPIQQQWADNVYNNFQTVLQDSLKVSVPKSEADRIWNDYVDHAYSIWNLEYDDLHQHYGHFRDYVGAQFEMEKNADNTYNYNMSEDAYTFIQDSFNTYLQENSLSYVQCYIYSYNYLNSALFSNFAQYTTIKEYIKNANGLVFANYYSNNTGMHVYLYTFPDYNTVGFYGSVSNGGFTNVKVSYNWNEIIGTTYRGGFGTVVRVEPDGSIITPQRNVISSWTTIKNTASPQIENSGSVNVFSNTPKNEPIYVFNNLNAYKAYNSGSPQPYYQMSGYSGVIEPMGFNVPNTNGSYESIINNIQTGWTAQEVLELVDRIMSNGTGSGNGSGNGGSDSSGLWSRIGDAIGNLIDGIINVLTTVIEHLSDALLSVIHLLTGYTDDNGVVHEGLFGKLLNLVNSGFNNFLASIFSWLPEEIVTLFTAVLVFGIFFGLLKMLRR